MGRWKNTNQMPSVAAEPTGATSRPLIGVAARLARGTTLALVV